MSRSGCNSCFYCTSCEESRRCPCNKITSTNDANRFHSVGVILSVVCVLFLFLGFTLPMLLDSTLRSALHSTQILAQDSDPAYENFEDTTAYPIRVTVYMMNLENPYDVVTSGAKPSFKEVGPFAYDMYRYAFNVSRNSFHTEMSYKYQTKFMFLEDNSVSIDTKTTITTANIPFWGVSYTTTRERDTKGTIPGAIDIIPELAEPVNQIFTNRTVNELLFGYEDPLLNFIHNFFPDVSPRFAGIIQNDTDIDAAYARVKAATIGTGHPNYNRLRQVYKFEETSHMEYNGKEPWSIPILNDVHGSDGSVFPVPFNTSETLDHFATTLYRNVSLEFGEKKSHKDIDVYRYKFPDTLWKNSEEYPFNEYYHQNGYSGLLNLTNCVNAELYLSLPRFQLAEEANKLIETDWDTKDKADFTTYFDLEPNTGAALNVYMASQLNIHMSPQEYTVADDFDEVDKVFYENLPDHYFPIFWSEQTAGINDKDANTLSTVLHAVATASKYAAIVSLSFAVFFGLLSFWIITRASLYHRNLLTATGSNLSPDSDEGQSVERGPNGLESISLDGPRSHTRYGSTGSTPNFVSKQTPHIKQVNALSDHTLVAYEELPQETGEVEGYRDSILTAESRD